MPLVEGLSDAVRSQYEAMLAELRLAVAESGYNLREIAGMADTDETTIRDILRAGDARYPRYDTIVRIMFVVGMRMEIARGDSRPFVAVPASEAGNQHASRSRGSRTSSSRALAKAVTADVSVPKRSKRRGASPPTSGDTRM